MPISHFSIPSPACQSCTAGRSGHISPCFNHKNLDVALATPAVLLNQLDKIWPKSGRYIWYIGIFRVPYLCFRRQISLPLTLSAGFGVWLAGALAHQWLLC